MILSVEFSEAPPLVNWEWVLTSRGWKIQSYTDNELTAKKKFGETEFPVVNPVTWIVDIDDCVDNFIVEIEVPAFAESDYAKHRMLRKIQELADLVDGPCSTDQRFTVDMLKNLRNDRSID